MKSDGKKNEKYMNKKHPLDMKSDEKKKKSDDVLND